MPDTKLKEYMGVEIFVDEAGSFFCTVDGKKRKSTSMKSLEIAIRNQNVTLPAIIIKNSHTGRGHWQERATRVEITGIIKRGHTTYLKFDEQTGPSFSRCANETSYAYEFTEKRLQQLNDILDEIDAMKKRHREEQSALEDRKKAIAGPLFSHTEYVAAMAAARTTEKSDA